MRIKAAPFNYGFIFKRPAKYLYQPITKQRVQPFPFLYNSII